MNHFLKQSLATNNNNSNGESSSGQNDVHTQDMGYNNSILTDVVDKQNIVKFADAQTLVAIEREADKDPTYDEVMVIDSSLSRFLERPRFLSYIPWTVGLGIASEILPWDLTGETTIINKLNGFQYFRAKLCIRILINGTPFHYGKLLVAYRNSFYKSDQPTLGSSQWAMQASTFPHVYLDASTNQSVELVVPFYFDQAYATISAAGQLPDMGHLHICSLEPLRVASATASSEISIQVFTRFIEPELIMPSAQAGRKSSKRRKPSGRKMDSGSIQRSEYQPNGVISNLASVASKIGTSLSDVPIIGGAMATAASIASGIGHFASVFGFSRPVNLTDTVIIKREPFGLLAATEGLDNSKKLTYDMKNELTIDPSTVGLGSTIDELSIAALVGREAFIKVVPWDTTNAVSIQLSEFHVSPSVAIAAAVTGGTSYTMVPVAHIASNFQYWTGTLIYRFQIAASAFHKGRLKFTYEPHGSPLSQDLNMAFSYIVDLDQTRDFEIEIPWGQQVPFLEVDPFTIGKIFINPEVPTAYDIDSYNGNLYCTVLTNLVSPDTVTASEISINCFMRAGEDFSFAQPHATNAGGIIRDISTLAPQADNDNQNAAVEGITITKLFDSETDVIDEKSLVFFGEKVVSMRSFLKRYVRNGTIAHRINHTSGTRFAFGDILGQMAPRVPGYTNTGYSKTIALERYNYAMMSPISWVAAAFSGSRGSIRHKLRVTPNGMDIKFASISRLDSLPDDRTSINVRIAGSSSLSTHTNSQMEEIDNTGQDYCSTGALMTAFDCSPSIEFELPFYSNLRFASVLQDKAGNATSSYVRSGWRLNYKAVLTATENGLQVNDFVAAGEDFTCFYYMAPPLVYIYTDLNPPSDPT